MAWIESHQEVGRHPKTRKLARRLDVSIPAAVGHLHCLWHWALVHAFDGDLTGWEAEDIAIAAMWEGDPDDFIKALLEARGPSGHGYLEEHANQLVLHDWDKYTAHLRARRESAQKANHVRWHSGRNANDPSCEWCRNPESSERNPNGQQSESTVPDLTEPNQTRPNQEQKPSAVADRFNDFWNRYPKRNGKRIGRSQAFAVWKRLSNQERDRAEAAVDHYRSACDSDITIAKDAHRWLSGRVFNDWLEPATPSKGSSYANGTAADYEAAAI